MHLLDRGGRVKAFHVEGNCMATALTSVLTKLGVLHRNIGCMDEALATQKRVIKVHCRVDCDDSGNAASSLCDMSSVLALKGMRVEA